MPLPTTATSGCKPPCGSLATTKAIEWVAVRDIMLERLGPGLEVGSGLAWLGLGAPSTLVFVLAVQAAVQLRRPGRRFTTRPRPGRAEVLVVRAPAVGARAMAGGEGGRLVEEEELGVGARAHDRMGMVLELENAADPCPAGPSSFRQVPIRRVNPATAVPEHRAAGGGGNDFAPRRHPVLQRHRGSTAALGAVQDDDMKTLRAMRAELDFLFDVARA